ncbi:MAG: hypothetical protein ABJA94_07865 [Rhodoglobus sp.]
MHEVLRRLLVRPAVDRWLATSDSSWLSLPRPTGKPTAQVIGPNPDRLLLVGSGISVGYAADTHDLALAGQLARRLSEITGRGARVDVLVTDDMNGFDIRESLTRKWLSAVDSIIATPGGVETLLLHSPTAWRRQIASLLDHIADVAPASLHVFIVGLPPLPTIVRMPFVLGRLAWWSARGINHELRSLCESRRNTTFIAFEPTERAGRTGTGSTYYTWAQIIAPLVGAELESSSHPLRNTKSAPAAD